MRAGLQQAAFNLLYRWGRWAYDPLTWLLFGSEWHSWRRAVLPYVGPGTTLEIGCGTGALLDELAARSRHVIGLDIESAMIERATRRKPTHDVDLVQGDARRLPFADSMFDSCVWTFPSNVVLQQGTREEIARVLAAGGSFVVVLSGHLTGSGVIRTPVRLALRAFYGSSPSSCPPPDDLLSHPLLPGRWITQHTANGFAFVWIAQKTEASPVNASVQTRSESP